MRLIDLSSPVDAAAYEPDPVRHEVLSPADGAKHMAAELAEHFGIDFDPASLPDGEFLSLDTLTLTTHTGTHVDAPSHYGTRARYGTPRHIDAMPLDWFFRSAVVLDVRGHGTGALGVPEVRAAVAATGHRIRPHDIVLLHTGASAWAGTSRYFTDFTGLNGNAVRFLLDLGVRVIGTDAFSLDAPFVHIVREYARTGDRSVLWPAHLAGRECEYCQIERLAHLDALPAPDGFTLACFPIRVAGAGAGWTRAVALLD